MSIRFLWLLLLIPFEVYATGWTGISAFAGKTDSVLTQASSEKNANIDFYGLSIEENTDVDLRVGARAGKFDIRLVDAINGSNAEKYAGQFFSVYLRWPIKLTDKLVFHSRINYQMYMGSNPLDSNEDEINFNEFGLDFGISFRFYQLSIRPYINFRNIDGDMTSTSGTRIFQQSEIQTQGIMLDYFVERSAYVRLQGTTGAEESVIISFVREF